MPIGSHVRRIRPLVKRWPSPQAFQSHEVVFPTELLPRLVSFIEETLTTGLLHPLDLQQARPFFLSDFIQLPKEVSAESPPAILAELAQSPYEDIRLAVVGHPATPIASLISLAWDSPQPSVRTVALKRIIDEFPLPEILSDLAVSAYEDVLTEVISHSKTPESTLVNLARNCKFTQIRSNALEHVTRGGISSETLIELAGSQYQDVLAVVAKHPQTHLELLVSLMISSSYSEVRKEASKRVICKNTLPETLAKLASSRYEDVLLEVARHSRMPTSCVPQLAKGLAGIIRNDYYRQETKVEQIWIEDTTYDAYGGSYSSGGHYEDQEVVSSVLDYDRINSFIINLPPEVRIALREHFGELRTDPNIKW